jgi:hypothetical protein
MVIDKLNELVWGLPATGVSDVQELALKQT